MAIFWYSLVGEADLDRSDFRLCDIARRVSLLISFGAVSSGQFICLKRLQTLVACLMFLIFHTELRNIDFCPHHCGGPLAPGGKFRLEILLLASHAHVR
jgi:hypothetical protein